MTTTCRLGSASYGCFYEVGCVSWASLQQEPWTILGSISGSLTLGNSHTLEAFMIPLQHRGTKDHTNISLESPLTASSSQGVAVEFEDALTAMLNHPAKHQKARVEILRSWLSGSTAALDSSAT